MTQSISRLSPEMLVPRMGEYLVAKGVVTEEQLKHALDYQIKQAEKGEPVLLGQALVDLNYLDRVELDTAVTEQIIQLRNALQAANRTLEQRVHERTNELRQALERVSELSGMKANFISNISHELRTPLTHIKGYIELLIAGDLGPITEEQKRALLVSQESTTRLENLIEDLIMVSLISRGEMNIKYENVDIDHIATLVVNSHKEIAERRGVELSAEIGENIPLVQADLQKIGWALGHLIDNGIKFTSKGGTVTMSVMREGENLVICSVTDTGIGIHPDQLKDIFEPFHQLDGTSTRKYGGTGLGLSLVRQIIEGHGSMIEVQSTEGQGTIFKFPLLAVMEVKQK